MTTYGLELDFEWPDVIAPIVDSLDGEGPFADIIMADMWAAVDVLTQVIVDETPVQSGLLSAAISQAKTVDYGEGVWTGVVSDGGVEYGLPVEFGRAAGRPPPVEPIELWIKRKGIQWSRTTASGQVVPLTTNQMAWALVMHIAREGTQGAFMFREGMRIATPAIEQIYSHMLDAIVARWGAID